MLPAEALQAYSFAVPLRIVLWQHVGDLWPLGGITKEKWPVGTRRFLGDFSVLQPYVCILVEYVLKFLCDDNIFSKDVRI